MNQDDKMLLFAIKQIRVKNNDPWLDIVGIALEADRARTVRCLSQILANDQSISKLVKALVDAR